MNLGTQDSKPLAIGALHTACALLARLSIVLAVIGLIGVICAVQWQVIGRYLLNDTPSWAEPLALQLVLYVTAFGVAIGVRDAAHIGLESLLVILPARIRRAVEYFIHFCIGLFGGLMIKAGWVWMTLKWDDIKPLLGVPVGVDYLALVVSGSLIVLFSLEHIVALAKGARLEPVWS